MAIHHCQALREPHICKYVCVMLLVGSGSRDWLYTPVGVRSSCGLRRKSTLNDDCQGRGRARPTGQHVRCSMNSLLASTPCSQFIALHCRPPFMAYTRIAFIPPCIAGFKTYVLVGCGICMQKCSELYANRPICRSWMEKKNALYCSMRHGQQVNIASCRWCVTL